MKIHLLVLLLLEATISKNFLTNFTIMLPDPGFCWHVRVLILLRNYSKMTCMASKLCSDLKIRIVMVMLHDKFIVTPLQMHVCSSLCNSKLLIYIMEYSFSSCIKSFHARIHNEAGHDSWIHFIVLLSPKAPSQTTIVFTLLNHSYTSSSWCHRNSLVVH